MKQVLVADRVITLDATGNVFAPGAVSIVNNRIQAVGTPTEVGEGQVLRLDGRVLMPGLVDVHTHTPMWLFRGLTEDPPRGEWLAQRMRPYEQRASTRDLVHAASAGCLELLLNGVTTIADRYGDMDAIAPAIEASGLRAVVAHSLYDDGAEERLEHTRALIERYGTDAQRSRVSVAIGPHATDTCGPELLRRVRDLAERTGARVVIHVAQSAEEVTAVRARDGVGCAEYLDQLGLLGPNVLIAHATYLSTAEAELVGRRGASVAHCPSSNAKLEGRIAPVGVMRAAGATVGLGTDAAACNNGMDLFEEMKIAGLLNKVAADDPSYLTADELLSMATLEGARALGMEQLIGSIEADKYADLIAIRTDGARVRPWHNDAANLVYAVRGSDVSDVWVGGEQVMCNGQPTRLDVEAIVRDASKAASSLVTCGYA
ncbi:MAG: amidohydrolase [Chloroflexi bacterium]|nr:amidohydrolase [Chloroflexota bacterium]